MSIHIDNIKRVYLLGIGGIGMSGLARYFNHLGCEVSGYDRMESDLTKELVDEGISIIYEDRVEMVPRSFEKLTLDTLVIYTPAVPAELSLKRFFSEQGHHLYKRAEVLGIISANRFTIAVAGTHGKTTTSSMIAHILKDSGYGCSAFLGGISTNYNSNVLFGDNNVIVVEADEYDRSFLSLHPNIAVVTSLQADHLDVYGSLEQVVESFQLFLNRKVVGGESIVRGDIAVQGDVSYGLEQALNDVYAEDITVQDDEFYFTYVDKQERIENIHLALPGLHNIENALAAIKVAKMLGIHTVDIKEALTNFKGIKRRFQYIVREPTSIYIDDYAHHPEELRAFLASMKKLYPGRKLTVVFQPHLFSRTRDFVDDFAEVLAMADELLLMEIYPARELPIEGVTSSWLLEKVALENKRVVSKDEVVTMIAQQKPELLATIGAGDIDRLVQPLKEVMENVG